MIGVVEAFSTNYGQSRVKFLEAAATAGLQIESFNAPLLGKDAEVLALDVAFDAALQKTANVKTTEKLLVVNSASKAADSLAGSGVQVFALHDAEWMDKVHTAGVSVLYLHGADQSLTDVVKKHIFPSARVILVDLSVAHSLKNTVNEALSVAKLTEKCKFSTVKAVPAGTAAWEGQTISLARQALFKAVDELNKA
jgi:Protein of unknown function (DUF2817)